MSKIISISEAASIGLHAMILIKRAETSINANEIAERTGNSKHHVAKILQQLAKQGYINSLRGPQGGFNLKKDAHEINFLDIYESIEGPLEKEDCTQNNEQSILDKCIASGIINSITDKFRNYLKNQTLDKY